MSEINTVFVVNASFKGGDDFKTIGVFSTRQIAETHLAEFLDARWGKDGWRNEQGQHIRIPRDYSQFLAGYVQEVILDQMVDTALENAEIRRDLEKYFPRC